MLYKFWDPSDTVEGSGSGACPSLGERAGSTVALVEYSEVPVEVCLLEAKLRNRAVAAGLGYQAVRWEVYLL